MSPHANNQPVKASGTYRIGGDLPVDRLGYGSMQLAGPGVWDMPDDPAKAVRVLRRAVELGVTFIDTADSYGPLVCEMLIKEALHPYADDLVIATKAGLVRGGPNDWKPLGLPRYLRQQCEMSLRYLNLDCIPLYQLHRIDPEVPLEDQLGELVRLQQEGKIRHIGLSEVTVEQIEAAREITPIATVQNRYNVSNRDAEPVLEYCERNDLGFIPWYPIATGDLARPGGPLQAMSAEYGATPVQLALAWLLRRSPVMLPIPGTSSIAHLEENLASAEVELTDDRFEALTQAA
ncbi:aldo/keto reductase [Salinispora vitiensis]|uniref:aldo/keto reductase n=1 Tax=Salinispora vitiensis TaxID=999544 RepID=UPI00037EC70C|nr:aldo/keto reductase [Salinispora vitiensis]